MKNKNPLKLYPHFKLTGERFPRLLITRKILNKKDEYFGAFLSDTAVRIWLYQLAEIFRLRSCRIEIDGNFPLPCHLYFTKKCVAPCVAEICSEAEYAETVVALRLFLKGNLSELQSFIVGQIDKFSEELEFEKAARWRDVWQKSLNLLDDKKIAVSLEDAVDTYSYEENEDAITIYLLTTRGRKLLGDREFNFHKEENFGVSEAIKILLEEFYQFHAPREIRLPVEIANRKDLEKAFQAKYKTRTKISVIKNELNTTAKLRFKWTKVESEIESINLQPTIEEIKKSLFKIFKLSKKPKLIEAFDVAHISNDDFITANSVWENGDFKFEKVNYWKPLAVNEPQAMAEAVAARLREKNIPDLILIDGAKGQLNAVINLIEKENLPKVSIISIVKPPGKHSSASHFLDAAGNRIEFVEGERVFELLRRLRDEAHKNANELHRQYRDNKYIFAARNGYAENAQEIPLIIAGFNEIGGDAEDLQPIKTFLKNKV